MWYPHNLDHKTDWWLDQERRPSLIDILQEERDEWKLGKVMKVQGRKIWQRTLGLQGWCEVLPSHRSTKWLIRYLLSSWAEGCNHQQPAMNFCKVGLLECQEKFKALQLVALPSSLLTFVSANLPSTENRPFPSPLVKLWSLFLPFRTLGWVGCQPKSTMELPRHKDNLCHNSQQHCGYDHDHTCNHDQHV